MKRRELVFRNGECLQVKLDHSKNIEENNKISLSYSPKYMDGQNLLESTKASLKELHISNNSYKHYPKYSPFPSLPISESKALMESKSRPQYVDAIEECACQEDDTSYANAKVELSYRDSSDWKRLVKESCSLQSCSCAPSACSTLKESENRVEIIACNACLYCSDVCDSPFCIKCTEERQKIEAKMKSNPKDRVYSRCEVQRHISEKSCWIVVNRVVYDVTSFLSQHPAGKECILKYAGGEDCRESFDYHSQAAKKLWKSFRLGKIVECKEENSTKCSLM